MRLFGREYSRMELEARIGNMAQLCGFKEVACTQGLEKGTAAIHVWNAAGLQFWILPDRGMDIGMLHYKGIPLTWSSKTGYVHPGYLQNEGWPKGFHGGLLATCGLNNVGPLCRDGDAVFEQHGSISRTPASGVTYQGRWQQDDYLMAAQGTVDDADSKGRHLQLHRTIQLEGDGSRISIIDRVSNLGISSEPCMLQYHMNFGFPLVDSGAALHVSGVQRVLENGNKEVEREQWGSFPTGLKQSQVLYYDCGKLEEPWGKVVLSNPGIGLQTEIEYTHETLPHLWRWNQFTDGLHVCAIEPSNCRIKPRVEAAEQGLLPILEPGQTQTYGIRFNVKEITQGGSCS